MTLGLFAADFLWLVARYGADKCETVRFRPSIARLFQANHLAFILLPRRYGASLLPPARKWHEEKRLKMIKLVRELLIIAMLGTVSVGAFAQKKDQDKRPPKEPVKVITNDRKDQRPPPRNDNQQRPKDRPPRP